MQIKWFSLRWQNFLDEKRQKVDISSEHNGFSVFILCKFTRFEAEILEFCQNTHQLFTSLAKVTEATLPRLWILSKTATKSVFPRQVTTKLIMVC